MNQQASPSQPLVKDPANIRIAMLGMIPGNGHPFSWSAIINGQYDTAAMEACGYPVIPQYLGRAPKDKLGIGGAKVTHVWCDDPADGPRVAKAAFIPNVVREPEDVLGHVDAVIIATDDGSDHVRRAKPFVDAGVPVFVDKPLADNTADLAQFIKWQREGKAFLSTSAMRYAPEFIELKNNLARVGQPRVIHVTMCKTWERYGIHALEGVYPMLAPGQWRSVQNAGDKQRDIVVVEHDSGVQVILSVVYDMVGAFAHVNAYGTQGHLHAQSKDTFTAFRSQLVSFVEYLRTGVLPVSFDETTELMKIVIAGITSRADKGRRVSLQEIKP